MKVQDGEEILHELGPDKNLLWIWLFVKALPIGLASGGWGAGEVACLKRLQTYEDGL